MSDVVDVANDYAERLTAAALARRQAATAAARPRHGLFNEQPGARVCMDCLDPIAPARLRAQPDAVRCTECQERFERMGRL